MSRKVVVRKVKGGKLFRLSLELRSGVADVRLDGDLFIHPEEKVEDVELWLCRCLSMEDEEGARSFLQSKLDEGSIQIIGADSAELVSALWEAKS
ncbi:MAG: hypothetical protein LUQ16_08120 [Methanomassiliicoccales archaeon]|nr:hypothetical protein [Methanomassiliicoccales archaeon]MDD1755718.1 hypothetical protein [Methanomassiliicoccales archaeon]